MGTFGGVVKGGAVDILFLRDFRLELIIGVYEWERKVPQPVRLDLEIGLQEYDIDKVPEVLRDLIPELQESISRLG